MLAKKGSQQVYNTIPNFKEWLITNYPINVMGGFLSIHFTFSKMKELKMTTSKIVNQKHAWQCRKKWMTCFYLRKFFHFYEFSPWWHVSIQLSSTNLRWTWFTCNSKSNRTSMIVWLRRDHPSFTHLSCIQPLHVNCFKPFKFAFENKNESNMIRTNHTELGKSTWLAN